MRPALADPGAPPIRSAPVLKVEGAARPGGALFVTLKGVAEAPVHTSTPARSDTTLGEGAPPRTGPVSNPATPPSPGDAAPSNAVAHAPTLHWLGTDYPFCSEKGVWRAVVPVAISTRPGTFTLSVRTADGEALQRTVTVKKVAYGSQSIWLPDAMLATYDSPRAKADDRLLLTAAKQFTPQRFWRGPFRLPALGRLSTRYGQARTYNGWRKGWHKGLDVAAGAGAPIRAPGGAQAAVVAPGQLVNGNATLLDHGIGVFSLYMHQSRIDVRKGQPVTRGALIGRVGSTGAGTGPHLHWACYVHGVPVDPQVLLHAPW